MRVPLDYYRILSLPVHADSSSVERAFRSRQFQELWPGYSSEAMESRQRLLERAHHVLSDPSTRDEYDRQLTVADSLLDVEPRELAAALAIQCENGEYQQALSTVQQALRQTHPVPDLLLTQAIARLHLGREEWADGNYSAAASMLQQALAELINHRVFPEVQAEVISDLSKLRPYRILKLLSHPHLSAPERQEGLSLFRSMLDDRAGIEGSGQDGSELSTEDFLRFVQKTRGQMTIDEQQELFEAEAKRPSVVATYLAVYALIARGFVENRPALIRRARGYLVRLTQRHDVNLEQAICALLLGQPEEATRLLERSKDSETIANIREEADISGGGETDLLLGLCRYTETWLQQEVFPEYRDLDTSQASLRTYFDNPQVQQYLDEMPASSSDTEWFARQIEHVALPSVPTTIREGTSGIPCPPLRQDVPVQEGPIEGSDMTGIPGELRQSVDSTLASSSAASELSNLPGPPIPGATYSTGGDYTSAGFSGTDTYTGNEYANPEYSNSARQALDEFYPVSGRNTDLSYDERYEREEAVDRRRYRQGGEGALLGWLWKLGAAVLAILVIVFGARALTGLFGGGSLNTADRTAEVDSESASVDPAIVDSESGNGEPGNEASLGESDSTVASAPVLDTSVLNEAVAQSTIEAWQDAKQEALGSTRDVEALGQVLAEPMLSQWRSRAAALQQANSHYNYTLKGVSVEEVTVAETGDSGNVVVSISEVADYMLNGVRQGGAASYDSTYRVRYNLVREGDRWLIESFATL
ncbi:MAG: IMS domain-containing protein [Cyanobacteria bacterium P01_E01_bin.45]